MPWTHAVFKFKGSISFSVHIFIWRNQKKKRDFKGIWMRKGQQELHTDLAKELRARRPRVVAV